MGRPSNWYQMDYAQQCEWERTDRLHREALDDEERRRREVEENAERSRASHRREMMVARQEYASLSEDYDETREQLSTTVLKLAKLQTLAREVAEQFVAWFSPPHDVTSFPHEALLDALHALTDHLGVSRTSAEDAPAILEDEGHQFYVDNDEGEL